MLVQLWLFLSPVAYPLSVVSPTWRPIFALNPVVGLMQGFRWAVLGTDWDGSVILISSATTVALLVGGIVYFQRVERSFADVI
jgi:lipopolysaccharide transport system permease protein